MRAFISPAAWVWQPIGSPLTICAGTVVLALLALFAYGRSFRDRPVASTGLFFARLLFIGALLILLLGPSRMLPQQETRRRPKLTVLLDTSQSMLTTDCRALSRFRYAQSQLLTPEQLGAIRREFDVELYGFDEEVRPLSTALLNRPDEQVATGRFTLLSDSVTSALARMNRENEGDAVLVISDGHDSEETPVDGAAMLARSKQVPIYTAAVGGATMQMDLALLAVPMQEYLLPGEPGSILVKVYQTGLGTASTTITLDDGEQKQSFPIAFGGRKVVELQLPVQREQAGQYEYQVTVEALDDEAEVANNSQTVFIEAQKRRIRVLALEGQPFWDSKFLAQSLRKDERIELTQITQLSAAKRETLVTRVEGTGSTVPVSADEWAGYDVVILGKSLENVLDVESADQLADFVSHGGGHVIFARGPAYDRHSPRGTEIRRALAALEPVVWADGQFENLSLSLTPAGRSSQWLAMTKMGTDVEQALERLPGLEVMPIVERVKAATVVIARASVSGGAGSGQAEHPAVVRMNFGRGSVVGVLGEGLWRWSLLSPENQDLAGFYDTFWSNLVRWLAMGGDFRPGQQVSLQLSRSTARLGDELTADVVYKHTPPEGAHPHLEVTTPGGRSRHVALSPVPSRVPRFRATIKPEAVGVHDLSLHAPGMIPNRQERRFNVYDVNLERLHTAANPMALRMLAEHSGGLFFEADQLGELLDQLRRYRASMLSPPRLVYIWDQTWIMIVLLVWIGTEWLMRRLAGFL